MQYLVIETAKYLRDAEIAIVERSVVEVDEDIMVTQLGYFCFLVKLKAVEAVLAREGPLVSSTWSHDLNRGTL